MIGVAIWAGVSILTKILKTGLVVTQTLIVIVINVPDGMVVGKPEIVTDWFAVTAYFKVLELTVDVVA